MRNLFEHREIYLELGVSPSSGPAVSVHSDSIRGGAGDLVVCTQGGTVVRVPVAEGNLLAWDLNEEVACEEQDHSWCYSVAIVETGSVFLASRKGTLASIRTSEAHSPNADNIDIEGYIDAGVAAVLWSPDQSCLAMVTRANTLLIMTDSFDVLQELPVTAIAPNSDCGLAWSGDGEFLAMISTDEADNIARVRVMTKHLEAVSTGRGVQDGAGGVVKDLCSSMLAFAPNGSLIASVQKKAGSKYQVVFFEKNGLRHGEFDIRVRVPLLMVSFDFV
jgi:WD40 repeat protein